MGGARARGIAISLDGRPIYIRLIGRGAVVPVSTSAYHVSTPVKVGILPATMTITPNGKALYVGDWDPGTVIPINTATNTAGKAIRVAPRDGFDMATVIMPDAAPFMSAAAWGHDRQSVHRRSQLRHRRRWHGRHRPWTPVRHDCYPPTATGSGGAAARPVVRYHR